MGQSPGRYVWEVFFGMREHGIPPPNPVMYKDLCKAAGMWESAEKTFDTVEFEYSLRNVPEIRAEYRREAEKDKRLAVEIVQKYGWDGTPSEMSELGRCRR